MKNAMAILLLSTTAFAADLPTLQRRVGPPAPTCTSIMVDIRNSLWKTSIDEANLAIKEGDKKSAAYYQLRAKTVLKAPELNVTPTTCSADNLKTLNVMVAEWRFDYITDLESYRYNGHDR
jgi:hypothetical protein